MIIKKIIDILSEQYKKTFFIKYNKLNSFAIASVEWVIRIFNILPKNSIQIVNGVKMNLDYSTPYKAYQRYFSQYEHEQINFFTEMLKSGDTVLDIGAYQGDYALVAAKKVGKEGKVYAFEPDPDRYKILRENIELNSFTNIEALEIGCSDKDGYVNYECRLQSPLQEEYKEIRFNLPEAEYIPKFIRIKTVTVDSFLKLKNLTPKIIKIDIEGWELLALRGMQNTLEKNITLFLELHPTFLPKGQDDIEEIIKLLDEKKFKIFDWKNKSLINPKNKYQYTKDELTWYVLATKEPDLKIA